MNTNWRIARTAFLMGFMGAAFVIVVAIVREVAR